MTDKEGRDDVEVKRKIKQSILVLLLLLGLCGCRMEDIPGVGNLSGVETESTVTQQQADLYYGYQTLSEEEKQVYRQLMAGLEAFEKEIRVSPIAKDRLEAVANMVMTDHPEYFWTEGGFRYYEETWPGGGTAGMKVLPDYLMSQEAAAQVKTEIEATAKEWLSGIPSDADTYEKIKYVYETLIHKVDYNETSPNNQNIQSVFLGKSSVCMGYAKATQYLLNQMGIFCTLVTGTVTNGSEAGHAWNLVKIQDAYYYVDTTWGTPGYSAAEASGVDIFYSYLCCNDKMLKPTHKADGTIPLPVCEDDSYNYYKRKGCWYEGYDRNQMYQELLQTVSAEAHTTELCFASREAYDQAVADMVNGTLLQEVVQNTGNLSPGQQVSWQIYYGGWDNLLIIVWN